MKNIDSSEDHWPDNYLPEPVKWIVALIALSTTVAGVIYLLTF